MDGKYAVRAVGVPLDGVPGEVDESGDVEGGVAEVVDAVVITSAVGVRVLVAQHRGVDVTLRPDVLVLGLEGLSPRVLTGNGVRRSQPSMRSTIWRSRCGSGKEASSIPCKIKIKIKM